MSAKPCDEPVEDYYHEGIRTHLYGKRKRGDEDEQSVKNQFDEMRAASRFGIDFTIKSQRNPSAYWKVTKQNASLCSRIRSACMEAVLPFVTIDTFEFPKEFDILTIDILVDFLIWSNYNVRSPLMLRRVEAPAKLDHLVGGGLNSNIPIIIHFNVLCIGKYAGLDALAKAATIHMECILSRYSDPLTIEVFRQLVNQMAWAESTDNIDMDFHKYDDEVRRMVATYGAIMEPLWRVKSEKELNQLISVDGPSKEYAKWHVMASRAVFKSSNDEVAPAIRYMKNEYLKEVKVATAKKLRKAAEAAEAAGEAANEADDIVKKKSTAKKEPLSQSEKAKKDKKAKTEESASEDDSST